MRLTADKTLKMYVGGKFIRSESGQVLPATSQGGRPMNVPRASRKDIRDTTATMRAAQPGWAGRTATTAARSSTASPRSSTRAPRVFPVPRRRLLRPPTGPCTLLAGPTRSVPC